MSDTDTNVCTARERMDAREKIVTPSYITLRR